MHSSWAPLKMRCYSLSTNLFSVALKYPCKNGERLAEWLSGFLWLFDFDFSLGYKTCMAQHFNLEPNKCSFQETQLLNTQVYCKKRGKGKWVTCSHFSIFFFFVTFGGPGFLWGCFLGSLATLAVVCALTFRDFKESALDFFTFGYAALFFSGGEMFSGQDLKTWMPRTFWPLSSGGWPQVAVSSKLTFSIHLSHRYKETESVKLSVHSNCSPR